MLLRRCVLTVNSVFNPHGLLLSDQPLAEITEKCEHGLTDLYLAYHDKLIVGHCVNPELPDIRTLQVFCYLDILFEL